MVDLVFLFSIVYINISENSFFKVKTYRDHGCLFVEFETSKGVLVSAYDDGDDGGHMS